MFLYAIECKVNANERYENLLSNCRVQLCLCKGNAFYLNEETFGEVFCSKLENGLIWTMSFALKKCKSHRVYVPRLQYGFDYFTRHLPVPYAYSWSQTVER